MAGARLGTGSAAPAEARDRAAVGTASAASSRGPARTCRHQGAKPRNVVPAGVAAGEATVLTDRFDRALLYATHVHGGQVRKGTSTPYVAHLLAVAAMALFFAWSHRPDALHRLRQRALG